jgi:hypothetical protein
VAQHARRKVGLAAEGIDQRAVLVLGDGVDGEVAPRQILFQRHVGRGVEDEALVARRGLALGARQGVFLVRLGMQEHREILADRLEAARQHVLRRGADDDMVVVLHGQAEQPIAHRTADDVGLHRLETRAACCPAASAERSALQASAKRLRKASSATEDHRGPEDRQVERPPRFAPRAASPSPLERRYWLGASFTSALRAETWTTRRTPAARQAAAIRRGSSTCARAKSGP